MAPKHRGFGAPMTRGKRTARRPARQPLPDPSSASSSSTESEIPSATSPQIDLLAGKTVTTGRKVDFDFLDSEGFDLGRQLKEMGWESICSMDIPTYPGLVKEFYNNLSRGDGGLVSVVRGVRITVTAEILGNLLETPVIGVTANSHSERGAALTRLLGREMTDFEEVSANQLPLELRLLHNICSRILFPKTGRFEYVSERDVVVMDCVITGQPLNLPGMIIGYMAEAGSKKRATLPYGMILTKVFRSQGVNILENEPLKRLRHTDYYSLATVHRMGFRKVNGLWIRKGQDGVGIPEVGSAVPGPSGVGPSVETHSPGPSYSAPPEAPPAPSAPFASSSMGFSEVQLDQLKSLLSDQISLVKDDFSRQLLGIRELIYALEEKVVRNTSSSDPTYATLKNDVKDVLEKIKDIGGDSDVYSKCNAELQVKIETAAALVESKINEFMNVQREGMGKILEELKRILRF